VSGKITIIILNYNGMSDLKECLPSVLALDDSDYDVLVVDNGSTDGSCAFISETYPEVKLLKLDNNLGFAEGNNAGLKEAFNSGAEYVSLLNNDTKVDANWLKGFRKAFTDFDNVGICGGLILDWHGRIVEYDGSIFNPKNASGGYVDKPVEELGDRGKFYFETAYACGGSCSISKECYIKIGGFDTSFYFYNEDVDLCLRAWIHGFRVLYSPESIIYHRRGASVRRSANPGFRDYYGLRNALTTVIKNYESCTIRCIYRDLIRIYLVSFKWHLLKGALYNIFYLPVTLKKRFAVQRKRVITDQEIFERVCSNKKAEVK